MSKEAIERVCAAMERTPADYMDSCLAQRLQGEKRAGSYYHATLARDGNELFGALRSAAWEPYEHPAVSAPAVAFRAELPGVVDVVGLEGLPPDAQVLLADPKGTGLVEAVYRGSGGVPATHTTMLLGPSEDGEIVWTFFPGDPVAPSAVPAAVHAGRTVTVREALELGIRHAKCAP
jgi:hypothetical protein